MGSNSFTVSGRTYDAPDAPAVVICIDGSEPDYHLDAVADAVVCGSDVPAGRPAPFVIYRAMEELNVQDISRILVAGDTPRDLEAGTDAGGGFVVGLPAVCPR
ncbi:MAG: HAD hydrolase-like protein [Mycobacterium sp.]